MEDWYHSTGEDIVQNGGRGLPCYYNDSASVALQNVYPEHNWKLEKFVYKPKSLCNNTDSQRKSFLDANNLKTINAGFWKVHENHKKFYDWSETQLEWTCMEDWYNVTVADIVKNGGGCLQMSSGNFDNEELKSMPWTYRRKRSQDSEELKSIPWTYRRKRRKVNQYYLNRYHRTLDYFIILRMYKIVYGC